MAAVKPIDPKQAQDPAQVADATRLAAQQALASTFSTLQEIVAAARRNLRGRPGHRLEADAAMMRHRRRRAAAQEGHGGEALGG
jgi:hypothetical protein